MIGWTRALPRTSPLTPPALRILGIRGIPNRHGGFESFAQELAPFLVQRGWHVTVYCQTDGGAVHETWWRGVRLVCMPARRRGAWGTVEFDWRSTRHAAASDEPVLVLGYNTAVLSVLYRLRGIPNLLNMDGLEWKRQKYGGLERLWLRLNEWIGCRAATHVIADHPVISERYRGWFGVRGVSMVPYGARAVEMADPSLLQSLGLLPDGYAIVIARSEPENYILEIVRAYSECRRGRPLVVLGSYSRGVRYQRQVLEAAGPEVVFPGAIYDPSVVAALRRFARLYLHGHRVGGTNPSLVEALGAGSAVLAHDNAFNRWVCGEAAAFFRDENDLRMQLDRLLGEHAAAKRAEMCGLARRRHAAMFDLTQRLEDYEQVLLESLGASPENAPLERSDVA